MATRPTTNTTPPNSIFDKDFDGNWCIVLCEVDMKVSQQGNRYTNEMIVKYKTICVDPESYTHTREDGESFDADGGWFGPNFTPGVFEDIMNGARPTPQWNKESATVRRLKHYEWHITGDCECVAQQRNTAATVTLSGSMGGRKLDDKTFVDLVYANSMNGAFEAGITSGDANCCD